MAEKNPDLSSGDKLSDRDYLNHRMSDLLRERTSFMDHWKELSEFIDPRRGRFFIEDVNKGQKRHKNILNNKGGQALRKATAGMLAGAMSPSRPWFTFDLRNKELKRQHDVAAWLDLFKRIILSVFSSSNFYNMAPTMLRELLLFATGAMVHEDDFDDVARFYTLTAGGYAVGQNSRNIVDTIARQFQMTCYQMVMKFGLKNVSQAVRNNWDRSNYGAWHSVNHFIELNPFRDDTEARVSSAFLPFRSVYWEANTKNASDRTLFLRKSGYKGFPAYVPRWELTETDVYGTNCPGMITLGDIKQLQVQEREKAKAIAKATTPPLQGPPSLKNNPIPNLPGGVTINTSSTGKIEPLYKVDPRVQELVYDIQATERRIDTGFFVDLFMAITDMQGIQPKNELQLTQINEERLLQIGPVLEQIHGEWLSNMVSRTAMQVLDAGIMPPPPKALEGKELDIEFVSALAMAQRAVATRSIERTVFFAGSLTEGGWDMRAKINADFALDEYASLVGAPPRLIVPEEEVQQARDAEAQKAAAAEQMAMGQQVANITKMASDAKLSDKNVLSEAVKNAQQ